MTGEDLFQWKMRDMVIARLTEIGCPCQPNFKKVVQIWAMQPDDVLVYIQNGRHLVVVKRSPIFDNYFKHDKTKKQ